MFEVCTVLWFLVHKFTSSIIVLYLIQVGFFGKKPKKSCRIITIIRPYIQAIDAEFSLTE